MRFASLGSGSSGNCMVVEQASTRLLLDCGFSVKETITRLGRLMLEPHQISGILVTHEHDDHAKGAFKLAEKLNIPVWLSHGTRVMTTRYMPKSEIQIKIVDSHKPFAIDDIQITPFPVPHDAREPTQFVFSDGQYRLGVLTDVGGTTPYIQQVLSGCDALVLECNHDLSMLETGPYSYALKKRVGGHLGHLDNQSAAHLLATLDNSKLKHIVAAHLSAKNNTQALAKSALSQVLSCDADWIGIATQNTGFDWRSV
ncbi:MAG: MBL fold metallo-hydrolase [Betaproteobacteria bacterium]|nr:MBL fold metallo-hydrolase [Betaproteobacteria bacterium]MCH9848398.1 MBL fold metallo-hydrolase [Betaproteobacteria bacterium]